MSQKEKRAAGYWLILGLFSSFVVAQPTWAWGKRGHQIVGETSALLAGEEPGGKFLKSRQYDFGYYNNVPDFVWKRPSTYGKERSEHYLNLEIFQRAFQSKREVSRPFDLSRAEFEKSFPSVSLDAGRAFWRILELESQLSQSTAKLKSLSPKATKNQRQVLQEKWIEMAGPLGHYVADLSQPLHVTENHDGQLTKQKGLHHFFEAAVVDELYPQVLVDVQIRALELWPQFKKENRSKSLNDLLVQLANESLARVPAVLEVDRKIKRSKKKAISAAYRELVVERLTQGSLYLAEIYRRHLGWKFDGRQFYFFAAEPPFVEPGAR